MYNSLGQILEGDTKSGAVTLLTNTPVGQETYIAIQPRDPKVISTHFNYTFFFSSLWTVELSTSTMVSR